MKLLAITSYPAEAAATRFRVDQFIRPLSGKGIEVDLMPFFSAEQFRGLYAGGGIADKLFGITGSVADRITTMFWVGKYDLLFIQREAMPFGKACASMMGASSS